MKTNSIAIISLAVFCQTSRGGLSFTENFANTTVTPALTLASGWVSGADNTNYPGTAEVTSGPRSFITTASSDYNTVDFTAQTVFTLRSGGGQGAAFFGFGPGTAGGTYGEPTSSYFLRLGPSNFGPFIDANNGPGSANTLLLQPSLGDGTYMAQIQKTGNNVTFSVEQNYVSGAFAATPGLSITESMTGGLSFLNGTNSKIFIGTQPTTGSSDDDPPLFDPTKSTTFSYFSLTVDSPSLTAVPEPASVVALACLLGSGICVRQRRKPAGFLQIETPAI
ncbi:MAG: hypothetical protein WCK77_07850 [Verrucomicrobiota bacterium]